MISTEHKCIFVHIPKTGGTSIEDLIWGTNYAIRSEKDLWMGQNSSGYNKYQRGGLQHLKAEQIKAEVGGEIFDNYYKFSFIRNPWDKAVSQFVYLQRRKDLLKLLNLTAEPHFKDYLRQMQTIKHIQWEPQWPFVMSCSGEIQVDFIGRYENYLTDLHTVLKKLNIATDKMVPHRLKSKRLPYQHYYDQESQAIIHKVFEKDISYFGYQF